MGPPSWWRATAGRCGTVTARVVFSRQHEPSVLPQDGLLRLLPEDQGLHDA